MQQGMTLRDLARFAEIDHSTLSLIERGLIGSPRPGTQARIARALRLPIDRVFPR